MAQFFSLLVLRIGNFIAQYHFYIVAFIASSYLSQFVGVANVGYVFIGASILVALILYASPPIFRSFGTRNVITVLAFLEIATLLAIAFTDTWIPAVILVTLQLALTYAIFIGMDLLIEASIQEESVTGSTRTSYLTITNIAVLIAALSISSIIVGDQYWRAFVAAALVLLPFLALSIWALPRISFPTVEPIRGNVPADLGRDRSLRAISGAHFLLQMFYAWMNVYLPILLFSYAGFSWSEIGILLAFAMLPYIVLEYPLGKIADFWLGEKEMLTAGMVLMVISLVAIPFLMGAPFWVWAVYMLVTRAGPAAVEAMTEVHFFRHVTEKDTGTISFFRVLRPLGGIAAPLVASLALMVLTLPQTFAVFGVAMLLGIPVSLSIIDSK